MRFIEFVSWEIREGSEEAHHEMMRTWFRFVRDNHPEMFAEWKGARYYRETDRDGKPTGRYVMLFEFHTHEGYLAYKTRRAGYPGPYQAYEKVDPYQFFQEDRVRVRHWEPQETDLWLDFSAVEASASKQVEQRSPTMSFIEFESWEVKEGHEEAFHEMIRTWFRFVKEHHPEMFAEWKSARYYREVTRDGEPTGRYIMLFEFHTREGHHAYKERRKDYAGPYVEYKKIDPYQHFIEESVNVDYWEPQETGLWMEFEPLD